MKKNLGKLFSITFLLAGCKVEGRVFNLPKINIENLSISLPSKPIRGGAITSYDGC